MEQLQNGKPYERLATKIIESRIVLIARGIEKPSLISDTAKALYDAGIRFLEITFNQKKQNKITQNLIEAAKNAVPSDFHVGAGTVLNTEQLICAKVAGAEFILSPNTDARLINMAHEAGLVSIPGAFTPTEIINAKNAGGDIVKVFPASVVGAEYIRAIKAPISHIPLMAVGGISIDNISIYLSNGYCCCGLGGNILRNELIENKEFSKLQSIAENLLKTAINKT